MIKKEKKLTDNEKRQFIRLFNTFGDGLIVKSNVLQINKIYEFKEKYIMLVNQLDDYMQVEKKSLDHAMKKKEIIKK